MHSKWLQKFNTKETQELNDLISMINLYFSYRYYSKDFLDHKYLLLYLFQVPCDLVSRKVND